MDQTLSRCPHPLSRDAGKGEYTTGQYRGMLMRALALRPEQLVPVIESCVVRFSPF
ncbi:hypothetical protein [Streptomyces sp. NPDC058665]|uniref:hypothetical protein n=1 Tax=Streptomyces sp. NPDC058665 TaxID=3346586 RepID=UPI003662E0AD